jgi:hypothetical protein
MSLLLSSTLKYAVVLKSHQVESLSTQRLAPTPEESASLAHLFAFGHLFVNFGVTHVNAWVGENVKLVTART